MEAPGVLLWPAAEESSSLSSESPGVGAPLEVEDFFSHG